MFVFLGRNLLGQSLLLARRLVEAGVTFVTVHTEAAQASGHWDTHSNNFQMLRHLLLPFLDRAVSALLDDLAASGELDQTLIVMAGEFGRTPRLQTLSKFTNKPGRDHWGAVQSVFFAGGGVRGGTVIGSSDKIAAYPAASPQTPENMAATIYHALGIPETTMWHDDLGRPHHVYFGAPIPGLLA